MFWKFRSELIENFSPYFRKWGYFAKHNIILANDDIKEGDTLKYRSWGNIHSIKVTSFDISEARIYGELDDNGRGWLTTIRLSDLVDENDKPLEIDFAIKRKRKIYHGSNK